MSILRRFFKKGQIYFITCVTHNREPHLVDNYSFLERIFSKIQTESNIEIIAYSILKDHFHLIIDPKSEDVPQIIKKIKLRYSYQYRQKYKLYRKTLWQHRYWDHIIRDENDLNNHINYIHYNPIKHKLVTRPFDWRFSSIHNFKNKYDEDWGVKEEIEFEGNFGE